ncbi:MAG: hypothetical protein IJM71_07325 [Clostridia bacterium]|nr:hypothetical protein [Clostridia bacterium]
MIKEKYKEFLETFIPSTEMREYLSGMEFWKDGKKVADIIRGAPVPLETKAEWLEGDEKLKTDEALRELNEKCRNEVFCLGTERFDRMTGGVHENFWGPVSSSENAFEMIRDDLKYGYCADKWNILTKWCLVDGVYVEKMTWIIVNGCPVFFIKYDDKLLPRTDECLKLPVPYGPGDILTVDCRPFSPLVPVLLIDKCDGPEGTDLKVLYRDVRTLDWKTCLLSRGLAFDWVGFRYIPILSPLYRLKAFDGNLQISDGFMYRLGEQIGGDGRKGRALWNLLHGYDVEDEKTDTEIKKIISTVVDEGILESYFPD